MDASETGPAQAIWPPLPAVPAVADPSDGTLLTLPATGHRWAASDRAAPCLPVSPPARHWRFASEPPFHGAGSGLGTRAANRCTAGADSGPCSAAWAQPVPI